MLDPSDWLIIPGQRLTSSAEKQPKGVAGYASQVLWQNRCNQARNIRLIVGGTIADDNASLSHWNAFGKLQGFGMRPSRPGDRMGFAGWCNGISDNVWELNALAAINVRDNWGLETYYNAEITPWRHLTGDMHASL